MYISASCLKTWQLVSDDDYFEVDEPSMEYSPEPRTPRTPRTPKSQSMLRASMRDGEVVLSFNTGWKTVEKL